MRFIVVALAVLLAGPVSAQQTEVRLAAGGTSKGVVVRINMNLFVPSPVSDGDAAMEAQQRARKALYASAGRECEVLLSVIASECHLESLNVSLSRNYGQQQEGFNVTGNFGYRVVVK